MDFLKLKLVEYGLSFVVAPLAVVAMQLLKRLSFWVDSLKEWPKRAFVAVIVAVFVAIGNVTGVDFGVQAGDESISFLQDLDVNAIKVALGAGMAFVLHAIKKAVKK